MPFLPPVLTAPAEPPPVAELMRIAAEELRHPPGCHRMALEVTHRVRVGPFSDDEKYRATATLDDGRWVDFDWELTEDNQAGLTLRFDDPEGGRVFPFLPPSFGLFPDRGEDDMASSYLLVDRLLRDFEPTTDVTLISRELVDRQAAWGIVRSITLQHEGVTRDLRMDIHFEADTLRPRMWQAKLDRGVPLPDGPGRAKRMEVHLEANSRGVPTYEHVTGVLMLQVYRVWLDQEIHYTRVGSCKGTADELEAPPTVITR